MNKEDFLRRDLDTFKRKFALYMPTCKFEIIRYNTLTKQSRLMAH